jgi:hypothetical protein
LTTLRTDDILKRSRGNTFRTGQGVTVPRSQLESWATQSAAWVVANGFDGALLDIEGIDATKGDKAFLDSITLGYCALKAALEKALPGSLLTWASAFTPYASGVVGVSLPKYGFADFHALGQCVDYFLPGAYCTCTGGPAPAGADLKAMQITEETLSRGAFVQQKPRFQMETPSSFHTCNYANDHLPRHALDKHNKTPS